MLSVFKYNLPFVGDGIIRVGDIITCYNFEYNGSPTVLYKVIRETEHCFDVTTIWFYTGQYMNIVHENCAKNLFAKYNGPMPK